MTDDELTKVEELEKQEDIKAALKQTGAQDEDDKPVAEKTDKVWFGGYGVLLVGFGALHYVVARSFLGFCPGGVELLQRFTRVAVLGVLILGLSRVSEVYLIGRLVNAASRYNLKRIQRLVVTLALAFIGVSVLFANWYTETDCRA